MRGRERDGASEREARERGARETAGHERFNISHHTRPETRPGKVATARGSAEEERGIEELPTRVTVSVQGNCAFRETVSHHTRPGKQFHTGKRPGKQFERDRRAAHPRDGVSSGKHQSFTP